MIEGLMIFCLIGFAVELLLRFKYINIFSYIKARVIFCFLLAILFMFISSFINKEALFAIGGDNSTNLVVFGALALLGLIYLAECLTIFTISVINIVIKVIEDLYRFTLSKKNPSVLYGYYDGKTIDLNRFEKTLYISKSRSGKGATHAELIN